MSRRGILFCMRYPDDEGFVWRTVSRLRDMVAGNLDEFDCYIAFPKLTGRSVHSFEHLRPVEIDCYTLSDRDKQSLREFVGSRNIAALVYMSALPATLDMAFLKRLGIVTINTEEDSFDAAQRDSAPKRIAKFLIRRVLHRQIHDLHIANAMAQGAWLSSYAQIPDERVVVIPNGVDCTHYVPAQDGDRGCLDPRYRWVICVSQARSEKRVDMIIRTAAQILAKDAFSDVAFAYVGDGGMLPEWQRLAEKLELGDRFRFAGQQMDLRQYYQAAYLMVHAAKRESFGLVLAEAMACALPVVACAASGPNEIIEDSHTGRLVDVDDETAFQDAIESYLLAPELAKQHGLAGRQRVAEHFSIHRQAQDMAKAIRPAAG